MGVGNRVKLFHSVVGGREFIVDVKRQGRPGVKVAINVTDFVFVFVRLFVKKKRTTQPNNSHDNIIEVFHY